MRSSASIGSAFAIVRGTVSPLGSVIGSASCDSMEIWTNPARRRRSVYDETKSRSWMPLGRGPPKERDDRPDAVTSIRSAASRGRSTRLSHTKVSENPWNARRK